MCVKSGHDRKIDSCLSLALGALDNNVRGVAKWKVDDELYGAVLELVKLDRPMAESIRTAYLKKTPQEALDFVRAIKRERAKAEVEAFRARRKVGV